MTLLPILRAPLCEVLDPWLFKRQENQPGFLDAVHGCATTCQNSLMALDLLTDLEGLAENTDGLPLLNALAGSFGVGLAIGREWNNDSEEVVKAPTAQQLDHWLMEEVVHLSYVDCTGYRESLMESVWAQGFLDLYCQALPFVSFSERKRVQNALLNSLCLGFALGHVWTYPKVALSESPSAPTHQVFDQWLRQEAESGRVLDRNGAYLDLMNRSVGVQEALRDVLSNPEGDSLQKLLALGFEWGRLWERR